MHEARGRADIFGKVGEERDHVMLGLALDLIDAVDLPLALGPDLFRRLFRDHAQFGLRITGMGLDLEPDAEPVLRLPDLGHFGAGIAGNHQETSTESVRPVNEPAGPTLSMGIVVPHSTCTSWR